MEGRKFGLDQAMTGLSFVLLLIIVAIPIFMIVYNAFFYENKFDISLFVSVIGNVDNLEGNVEYHCDCPGSYFVRHHYGPVLCMAPGAERYPGQRIHEGHVYDSIYVPPIFRGHGMGSAFFRQGRLCE